MQSHLRGEEGVQHEDEGLVDVQISLDNGDHNLFEGSVEVNNEQESNTDQDSLGMLSLTQ